MASAVYLLPLLLSSAVGLPSIDKNPLNSHFPSPPHRFNNLHFSAPVHAQYNSFQNSTHFNRFTNYSTNTGSQLASKYGVQYPSQSVAKGRPTVRPAQFFNPQEDAKVLRNALQGFTDPDVIIGILTRRSNDQRRIIIMRYYSSLMEDLNRKLSFSFRDLMKVLVTPIQTYLSSQVKLAVKFSTSVDEQRLVELLSTRNNSQLWILKEEYKKMYGKSLSDDMTSFSLNKFTNFFSSYIKGDRVESSWVDHAQATKDAETLIKSGKLSIENGSFFRNILSSRSFAQLNRTFYEFQRLKHESIESTIKKDFSGDVRDGLVSVIKSILKTNDYFAEILHENIGSLSKRDATLIRIIVERAEIDMGDIKDSYGRLYRTSLETDISRNTSGSFKKALLALISG